MFEKQFNRLKIIALFLVLGIGLTIAGVYLFKTNEQKQNQTQEILGAMTASASAFSLGAIEIENVNKKELGEVTQLFNRFNELLQNFKVIATNEKFVDQDILKRLDVSSDTIKKNTLEISKEYSTLVLAKSLLKQNEMNLRTTAGAFDSVSNTLTGLKPMLLVESQVLVENLQTIMANPKVASLTMILNASFNGQLESSVEIREILVSSLNEALTLTGQLEEALIKERARKGMADFVNQIDVALDAQKTFKTNLTNWVQTLSALNPSLTTREKLLPVIKEIVHESEHIVEWSNKTLTDYNNGVNGEFKKVQLPLAVTALGLLFVALAISLTPKGIFEVQAMDELLERQQTNIQNMITQIREGENAFRNRTGNLKSLIEHITIDNKSATYNLLMSANGLFSKISTVLSKMDEKIKTSIGLIRNTKGEFEKVKGSLSNTKGRIEASVALVQDVSVSMIDAAIKTNDAQSLAVSSVNFSKKGNEVVRETIRRMNEIRDTMQNTSKRIKRLGESSQSISEVTDLIRGIAKQVQILSMNAAIEAAQAGPAGRNFSVVAQEIQRLANSSNVAAKRIDELVVVIQGDAQKVVSAMEVSTAEVVSGAALADQAGESLTQIESSSAQLSGEVVRIAEMIESQALLVANIAIEMDGLMAQSSADQASVVGALDLMEKTSESLLEVQTLAKK